ncbi:MAG: hypothetical protein JNN11_00605 [Candidatus Doudnabacteria bacterium]|nr:hypothetical protein [Candidatus Doudnabacteria bacterium]
MKQIFKKLDLIQVVRVIVMALMLVLPVVSYAQLPNLNCSDLQGVNCNQTQTVSGLIKLVINWMLALAGLIAVLFLIIGGFWYITSAGNEEQAEKGKGTVINAIIGIVIIVLSWVIVNVVSRLVSSNSTSGI